MSEWRDYMAQSSSYSGRSQEEEDKRQFFFDSIATQETLQQHLMGQLNQTALNANDRKTAELIIGNIDDNGFLQTTPEEMSMNTGIAQEDFENMLTLIQSFYPPGVGARDLRECLLIQLKREGKQNSLEYKIISEHMPDLGKRRFPEIARRMGISVEQVQKCANNIAQLDPRPGQIFAAAPQNYVLPDVTVEKINGEYQVILNGEQIPHLRISNTYKDIMSQDGNGSEVKDYIRDKIRSGKFLIKSIHQRQQTISNIAHQIVKRQREFFDHGTAHLKPMTMVQIADVVGVHETTVSRAISGKYMSTPQGVFEMKYFFTPGYQTATRRIDEQHERERSDHGFGEKRRRQFTVKRQGDCRDLERTRHSDRAPNCGQISDRAKHSAEQHAAEILRPAVISGRATLEFFQISRLHAKDPTADRAIDIRS